VPTSNSADNFVGIGSPCEGFWFGIVFDDEAIDGCLQVDGRYEDAALQSPLCQFGEEALDGVEPGCRSRGEVEGPAGMPEEPLANLRMLVGRVVIDDGVDCLLDRHLRFDGVEEANELLVPVALHVMADDGAVENVESGELRGRAMAFIVVGHRSGAARLHRQTGLGAIERLDLALLIDRENDRMRGRIDIEADDVAQLVDKLRVGGELELFHSMRLQSMRPPNPLDGTRADIDDLRHQRGGPVGRLCWRVALGERHDALGDAGPQRPDARRPGLIAQETVVSFLALPRLLQSCITTPICLCR
jgi:hypothetical protein